MDRRFTDPSSGLAGVLCLRRDYGEGIIIGDDAACRIWVVDGAAKLGVKFPGHAVDRCELWVSKRIKADGCVTPVTMSVIQDMRKFCPWQLECIDFATGKIDREMKDGAAESQERAEKIDTRLAAIEVRELPVVPGVRGGT